MHTNDIHGSYKYSYNASKGTGTVGFDGLAVLIAPRATPPIFCSMRATPSTGSPLPP